MTRQFQNFKTGVCLAKVCKDKNLTLTPALKKKFNYVVQFQILTFLEIVLKHRTKDYRLMQDMKKYVIEGTPKSTKLINSWHNNLNFSFHDICTQAIMEAIASAHRENEFIDFSEHDPFDHIMRYYFDRLFTLIVLLEVDAKTPAQRAMIAAQIFKLARKAATEYKGADRRRRGGWLTRHKRMETKIKQMEDKKESLELLSMIYGNLRCEI